MHRLALRRIAKLFMTICPEPVEFIGLQKSMTAKRIHKVLKVFATYQLPSSDTSEAGLKITHGILPVKKTERRNPTRGNQENGLRVPERIAKNQPGRFRDRRRNDVDTQTQTRKPFVFRWNTHAGIIERKFE
jgi:hypothetical protein